MLNLQKFKYCHVNLALFAFAASMMLIAFFFFQKHLGLLPCPLCVTQRIFAIGFGVIALIAALHNPAPHKQRIYSVLIALNAAAGAGVVPVCSSAKDRNVGGWGSRGLGTGRWPCVEAPDQTGRYVGSSAPAGSSHSHSVPTSAGPPALGPMRATVHSLTSPPVRLSPTRWPGLPKSGWLAGKVLAGAGRCGRVLGATAARWRSGAIALVTSARE